MEDSASSSSSSSASSSVALSQSSPSARKRPPPDSSGLTKRPSSWLYVEGPRDGDLFQLQWMRAGTCGKGLTSLPDLTEARYALPPLHVNLASLLPPHLVTIPSPDSGAAAPRTTPDVESPTNASNLIDIRTTALASDLVNALDSRSDGTDEAAVAEHGAYAQAAGLSAIEWRKLLAEPALSACLDAVALAELLHRTRSHALAGVLLSCAQGSDTKTTTKVSAVAVAVAAAKDALPRALRLSPTPLPHTTGMRLAKALIVFGGLDAGWRAAAAEDAEAAEDAASTFQETITALDLRTRAGEAGMELEICLAEVYFSSQDDGH